MDLLPSEQRAADVVRSIGTDRAERILIALARRFDRRFAKACKDSFAPINREWVRRTAFELELTHTLKIGLMFVDDYHKPASAHARILERLAARKTSRKSTELLGGHYENKNRASHQKSVRRRNRNTRQFG